jgi:hypothetical protein
MTVIALAGRRTDAEGAPPRFPQDQEPRVSERLDALLNEQRPEALVCSAACGADLLALEAAVARNIPVTIVLPFKATRFRATSVVDRPGDWGPRFDAVIRRVRRDATAGRIHVIPASPGGDDAAYQAATEAILEDAEKLAGKGSGKDTGAEDRVVAVVVWEGVSRGEGDLTEYFRQSALSRGFQVREIRTRTPE